MINELILYNVCLIKGQTKGLMWKLEMMVIKCIQNSPFKPDITLTIIMLTRNIIEINYERIK